MNHVVPSEVVDIVFFPTLFYKNTVKHFLLIRFNPSNGTTSDKRHPTSLATFPARLLDWMQLQSAYSYPFIRCPLFVGRITINSRCGLSCLNAVTSVFSYQYSRCTRGGRFSRDVVRVLLRTFPRFLRLGSPAYIF